MEKKLFDAGSYHVNEKYSMVDSLFRGVDGALTEEDSNVDLKAGNKNCAEFDMFAENVEIKDVSWLLGVEYTGI